MEQTGRLSHKKKPAMPVCSPRNSKRVGHQAVGQNPCGSDTWICRDRRGLDLRLPQAV